MPSSVLQGYCIQVVYIHSGKTPTTQNNSFKKYWHALLRIRGATSAHSRFPRPREHRSASEDSLVSFLAGKGFPLLADNDLFNDWIHIRKKPKSSFSYIAITSANTCVCDVSLHSTQELVLKRTLAVFLQSIFAAILST